VAGHIVKRIGAARTCAIAMVVLGAGLALVGLGVDIAHNRWVVAAGLFVLGLGMGTCDVAMNLEGANVERLLERSIMPRFHAAFSGGTVLAALLGAGMAALKVPVWLHLVTVAAILVLASGMSTRSFLPRSLEGEPQDAASPAPSTPAPSSSARSAWTEPRTILIGLVTLVAAFTEGTANDWVSVAFVEGYDLPPWAGVLAFATFLGFMTIGRILGTGLLDRYGRVPTLRVMLAVALLGSLMVVFGGPALAYVGAALWGLGVSLGFPVGHVRRRG
jgi:fucose permease